MKNKYIARCYLIGTVSIAIYLSTSIFYVTHVSQSSSVKSSYYENSTSYAGVIAAINDDLKIGISGAASNNAEVVSEPYENIDGSEISDDSADTTKIGPLSLQMYTTSSTNIRESNSSESSILATLFKGQCLTVTPVDIQWAYVEYDGISGYISMSCLADSFEYTECYNYEMLNTINGRVAGPSGNETYYNEDMSFIVGRLQRLGYSGEYWVRADGVKMFGDYVMVAAAFDDRPIGTIIQTTRGVAIVCDTGKYIEWDWTGIDVATNW